MSGRVLQGHRLLKQAIKLEPGQGDFYYLLGLCQGEMEVFEERGRR